MAQDPKIMAAALRRFQQDKEERRAQLERRTEEVYLAAEEPGAD